jgi:hypothetical protein
VIAPSLLADLGMWNTVTTLIQTSAAVFPNCIRGPREH